MKVKIIQKIVISKKPSEYYLVLLETRTHILSNFLREINGPIFFIWNRNQPVKMNKIEKYLFQQILWLIALMI